MNLNWQLRKHPTREDAFQSVNFPTGVYEIASLNLSKSVEVALTPNSPTKNDTVITLDSKSIVVIEGPSKYAKELGLESYVLMFYRSKGQNDTLDVDKRFKRLGVAPETFSSKEAAKIWLSGLLQII